MKNTNKKLVLVGATLVVIIGYICAFLISPMTYSTNDDVAIVNYLSRAKWGGFSWIHYYTNVFTSIVFGSLYILFPNVEWWYVAQHCLVASGIFVCNYSFLCVIERMDWKKIQKWEVYQKIVVFIIYFGLLASVNICLFGYILVGGVTWTVSPMVFGGGMLSLAMIRNEKTGKLFDRYIILGMFCSLLIASLIRMDTGYVLIAYALLLIAIKFIDSFTGGYLKWGEVVKCIFVSGLILLVLLGIDKASDKIKVEVHGEDYHEYQEARVMYIDHRHDSYSDNPEMYKKINWDQTIYDCVNSWIFVMEEVSEDSLHYAAENSESYVKNANMFENILAFVNAVMADNMCRYSAFFAIVLWVATIFILINGRQRNNLACVILNTLGTFVLLLYLATVAGRVNYRSFILVIIPASIINLHILLRSVDINSVQCKLLLMSLFVCITLPTYKIVRETLRVAEKNEIMEQKQLIQRNYAYENSESVYFVEREYMISPQNHDVDMADNIMTLGGGTWFDKFHKDQAIKNGIGNNVTCATFEKQNVFYMGTQSNKTKAFLKYMMEYHGVLGMALVDEVSGIEELGVYHFVYEDNISDFSEFYIIENNEWMLLDVLEND